MSSLVPVTVRFNGVLVGHYDSMRSIFEMGVLPSPEHNFTITIQEFGPLTTTTSTLVFNEIPTANRIWNLEIEGHSTSDAHILTPVPIDRRVGSTPGNINSFYWVLDFENRNEFPAHPVDTNGQMYIQEGLFKPIILVKHGEFRNHTTTKQAEIKRKLGQGSFGSFGHISQTVAADINAQPGESVVLHYGSGTEIFRLRLRGNNSFIVTIDNTPASHQEAHASNANPPDDINQPSHFQLFYLLFNVVPNQRYDLHAFPAGASPAPASSDLRDNMSDAELSSKATDAVMAERRIGAPTPYKCGPIFLGARTGPLI